MDLNLVQSFQNSDKKLYGSTVFTEALIQQHLKMLGLPLDSPLSVLTVEFLPTDYNRLVTEQQNALININGRSADPYFSKEKLTQISPKPGVFPYPLSRDLGKYRILRTSPLVAVPEICCEDC